EAGGGDAVDQPAGAQQHCDRGDGDDQETRNVHLYICTSVTLGAMKIETCDLSTSPARLDAVRAVLAAASRADGVDAFSEQFLLGLTDARAGHRHLLAVDGEEVLGLAACDGASCELV